MVGGLKTWFVTLFDILATAVASYESVADGVGALDMSLYKTGRFTAHLATCTATGTFDMKLQHSPDGTTWTDEDGATGNDTAITQLTVADAGTLVSLDIVRAQARYYRAVCVVGTDAVVAVVTQIAGPKFRVDAEA